MKVVVRREIETDDVQILKIFVDAQENAKSIEFILEDIEKLGETYQIVHKEKNRIEVYEHGYLYGKTLKYVYHIDNYFKDKYENMLEQLKKLKKTLAHRSEEETEEIDE